MFDEIGGGVRNFGVEQRRHVGDVPYDKIGGSVRNIVGVVQRRKVGDVPHEEIGGSVQNIEVVQRRQPLFVVIGVGNQRLLRQQKLSCRDGCWALELLLANRLQKGLNDKGLTCLTCLT